MRRILMVAAASIAALALMGVVVATTGEGTPGVCPDDVLSRSSRMTQEMSVPGPLSGHEYHVHAGDEQLRLSQDPGFVRELEVPVA